MFRLRLTLLCSLLLAPLAARASTFTPKTDNEIVAVDLRTGKLLWSFKPAKLSDAHFEVYRRGVVVFPSYSGDDQNSPLYLDPRTGKRVGTFPTRPRDLLARSATFHPPEKIRLRNGWRLSGFSPGNSKSLDFVDRRGKKVWSIDTRGYPHRVASWKNVVFWAISYLSKDGVLHAHRAGQRRPLWSVDLNAVVNRTMPKRKRPRYHGRIRAYPLTRMIFQVIDGVLYVNANEHVFAFDPATGKLRWHRDLARQLRLRYHPDFFGGALNLAVFAKSGSVLVVSFEKRVVALDLAHNRCLWHLEPDTFPHCPFPAAHGGRVFLTSGSRRKLTRLGQSR
jgi:outer membrane protein assembly factor BamB